MLRVINLLLLFYDNKHVTKIQTQQSEGDLMSDSQACKSVAKRNDNQITRMNANRCASSDLTGDPTGPKIYSVTVWTGKPITSPPFTRERISPCLRSASAALLVGSNASTTCKSDVAPHMRYRAGNSALAVPHPAHARQYRWTCVMGAKNESTAGWNLSASAVRTKISFGMS